jgi:hypothetical protein
MQWKQEDPAEPEGEGVGRCPGEDVVRGRLQHVTRERLADRQHVTVEVHRRLGAAGGARGEREHADVVVRGLDDVEGGVLGQHPLGPGVVAVGDGGDPQRLDRLEEPVVDERRVQVGDLVDGLQLPRPQQRHRGDHDGPGLQHSEPGGREPLAVRAAQEHAVPGHDPEILDEDACDPVRRRHQLAVRPGREPGLVEARPVRPVARRDVVEQGGGAVETLGVLELGQVEDQLGPLLCRREVVTTERVDVGRREQLHGRQRMPPS